MGIPPWRAGEEVAGSSARASRSRRIEVDCLSAELKREFFMSVRLFVLSSRMPLTMVKQVEEERKTSSGSVRSSAEAWA